VLNDAFVSDIYALVGLLVHPWWPGSIQYVHVLVCRSHVFGRWLFFSESLLVNWKQQSPTKSMRAPSDTPKHARTEGERGHQGWTNRPTNA